MMEKTIFWNKENVPEELHSMLKALSDEYAVCEGSNGEGVELEFKHSDESGISAVAIDGAKAVITYNSVSNAARGVGTALSGLSGEGKTNFKTLGIMLDCSRNAVMKVEHLKKWLRRLALMGYNMAMLYTEDTYQLPDEPYFGYLRGAYSIDEMKEVDAYAASLGIEMIGCIQTLGHLAQILRWADYGKVRDTSSVMLVDSEETYKLIDKMLCFWKEALGSRRIHIGMDETHDLGRGVFMDKFGYERGFDIFNRHLTKVNSMCADHGLKAMIWSDMYFRMGCESGQYYDEKTVIPDDVKEKIPADVDLVYWDYYHDNKEFYVDWINRHRDLGFEPPLGSGIWTWAKLWYDHDLTVKTVKPCLDACRETKLSELFFTMWGDDGACCEFDSALAGLCWAAEHAFGGGDDEAILNKRFKAICDDNYSAYVKAADIECCHEELLINASAILWDDPLLAIHWKDKLIDSPDYWNRVLERYNNLLGELNEFQTEKYSESIAHACQILQTLITKITFKNTLMDAYKAGDKGKLAEIKDTMVPQMIDSLGDLKASMRSQWMRRNKPFGFETIQNRISINIGRYEEVALVIDEFLAGKICCIVELDAVPDSSIHSGVQAGRHLSSGSIIS